MSTEQPALVFNKLDTDTRIPSGDIAKAAWMYAIVERHSELTQQDPEHKVYIRELIKQYVGTDESLLQAYVCGCGSYGLKIIDAFISKQPERGQEQYRQKLEEARAAVRA